MLGVRKCGMKWLKTFDRWLTDVNLLPFVPVLLILFVYSRWSDHRRWQRHEGLYRGTGYGVVGADSNSN